MVELVLYVQCNRFRVFINLRFLIYSESESYVTTDSQSVSLSCNKAPI
jgi:hypothetical protein